MRIHRYAAIEGVCFLSPNVNADDRGRSFLAYDVAELKDKCDMDKPFVCANVHYMVARSLFGLTFQTKHPRGSLYRCVGGVAQIVAVDLRAHSKTFGKYQQQMIDASSSVAFYASPGFATGFLTVGGPATIIVEHTSADIREEQQYLLWNDSQTGIGWAGLAGPPVLGTRERAGLTINKITPLEV